MKYVTPQGRVPAYTPQRRAGFPYPPQGIPVVVPPPPPIIAWSMFMYDHYHRGVAGVPASVIYFGCWDYKIYALNADGTLKWTYATGDAVTYPSPVVDKEGTIYIGSRDDYFYALNADGTLKWRFYTGEIDASAAVDLETGVIYVGSYSKAIYAFNPDGSVKWKYATSDYVLASVTLYDRDIYVSDYSGILYHLSSEGELIWTYSMGGNVWLSAPGIDSHGIYLGRKMNELHAINFDGTNRWIYKTTGDVVASPSIDDYGNIYFAESPLYYDGYFRCLNYNGELLWSYFIQAAYSSAALSEKIYIGSRNYRVYAFNYDGTLAWSYETGQEVVASPSIDKNETIFIGSADCKMYAFNPDGTVRWTFTAGDVVKSTAAII